MGNNEHDESLTELYMRALGGKFGAVRGRPRVDATFYEEHPEETLRRLREANEIEEEFNGIVADLDMPDWDDTPNT